MQLVSLHWDPAARASSYEVYYHTTDNFAASKKYNEEPTGTALTLMGLADSTVYYFWVVAKNAGGRSVESNTHTALETSDPVPAYLSAKLSPGGPTARYQAANASDSYFIRDLGDQHPASERYGFSYGNGEISDFYQPGIIKFARQFANPPEEPSIFMGTDKKPHSDPDFDINRGVIIYQTTQSGKFQATYYVNAHLDTPRKDAYGFNSTPPAAIMGQANGYSSGLGNNQAADTLEEAVKKFAKIGSPPIGGGGRYDYFTMMNIIYGFVGYNE
jgi:hypothetical protein